MINDLPIGPQLTASQSSLNPSLIAVRSSSLSHCLREKPFLDHQEINVTYGTGTDYFSIKSEDHLPVPESL